MDRFGPENKTTTRFLDGQFKISSNQSWRSTNVTIPGGMVQAVTFPDTTPNMFYGVNYSSVDLRVGISSLPSLNKYEFILNGGTVSTFGQPIATQQIYIFNPSDSPVNILLFSVYADFDFNVIRSNNIKIDAESIQDMGIVTGFGAGVSLPGGNAHLGSVNVDNLTNYSTVLNQILTKLNGELSTNSDVTSLPNTLFTALTAIQTAIENSGGGSGTDYSTILNNILSAIQGTLSVNSNVTALPDTLITLLNEIKTAIGTGGGGGSTEIDYTSILNTINTALNTLNSTSSSINAGVSNISNGVQGYTNTAEITWNASSENVIGNASAEIYEICCINNNGTQPITVKWVNFNDSTNTDNIFNLAAGYSMGGLIGSFKNLRLQCTAAGGSAQIIYRSNSVFN